MGDNIYDLYREYNTIDEDNIEQKKQAKDKFYSAITTENMDVPEEGGLLLFHLAAMRCDIELTDHLIKLGARLPTQEDFPLTPIQNALTSRNQNRKEVIKQLIKYGTDINEVYAGGSTLLIKEINSGRIDNCKLLIENGADLITVNKLDEGAYTAALQCEKNRDEILKLLFQSYLGLCVYNFAEILPPSHVVDNALIIYGLIYEVDNMRMITRQTPGFEKAITNIDEFRQAVKDGISFDYEKVYLLTKKRIEYKYSNYEIEQVARTKLMEFAQEVKRLWYKSLSISNLRNYYVFYLADHLTLYKQLRSKKALPQELDVEIQHLAQELEIKNPTIS